MRSFYSFLESLPDYFPNLPNDPTDQAVARDWVRENPTQDNLNQYLLQLVESIENLINQNFNDLRICTRYYTYIDHRTYEQYLRMLMDEITNFIRFLKEFRQLLSNKRPGNNLTIAREIRDNIKNLQSIYIYAKRAPIELNQIIHFLNPRPDDFVPPRTQLPNKVEILRIIDRVKVFLQKLATALELIRKNKLFFDEFPEIYPHHINSMAYDIAKKLYDIMLATTNLDSKLSNTLETLVDDMYYPENIAKNPEKFLDLAEKVRKVFVKRNRENAVKVMDEYIKAIYLIAKHK